MSAAEWLPLIQTAAAVLSAIAAAIALYFAATAARASRDAAEATKQTVEATKQASKDSVFISSTVQSLMNVVTKAREVRAAYRSMFGTYGGAGAKRAARTTWLSKREEVTIILEELAELLPDVKPAHDAWLLVEKVEDSHARNDTVRLPETKAITTAHEAYDEKHKAFLRCAGDVLKKLR